MFFAWKCPREVLIDVSIKTACYNIREKKINKNVVFDVIY